MRRVLPEVLSPFSPDSVGEILGKYVVETAEAVAKMWKTRCVCLTQARNTKKSKDLLDYFQRLSFHPSNDTQTEQNMVAYNGVVGDEAWRLVPDVPSTGEAEPDIAPKGPGVNGGTSPTAK